MKPARPDLLTIIVPRHPERGPLIAEMLRPPASTWRSARRASCPRPRTDIYVADTIGELGLFYALAPVAFIGGSLVPSAAARTRSRPIKLGAAVLTGPALAELPRRLHASCSRAGGCNAGRRDAASLAEAALAPARRRRARAGDDQRAPRRAIAAMSGALPRTLAELERYLPPKTTLQHAS